MTIEQSPEYNLWRADVYRILVLCVSTPTAERVAQLVAVCADLGAIAGARGRSVGGHPPEDTNAGKLQQARKELHHYRAVCLAFGEFSCLLPPALRAGPPLPSALRGMPADASPAHSGFNPAIDSALDLLARAVPGDVSLLVEEYHRLFTTRVACPACEGSYHRAERGPVLGDVAAFYAAFQVTPTPLEGPPDGLKIELTFLQYLALKKVYAMTEGLTLEMEITEDAERKFLRDHLGRWTSLFVTRLQAVTDEVFYHCAAELLQAWIALECKTFGISPTPLPGMGDDDANEPVCCSI